MTFHLGGITIDCTDPETLAAFWAALLDDSVSESLPGWARVGELGAATPVLTFQPVPEAKRDKVRIHLDLDVPDIDSAMATVVSLGGRSTGERHDYDEGIVVVMADPEGNEFCLVRRFDEPL